MRKVSECSTHPMGLVHSHKARIRHRIGGSNETDSKGHAAPRLTSSSQWLVDSSPEGFKP